MKNITKQITHYSQNIFVLSKLILLTVFAALSFFLSQTTYAKEPDLHKFWDKNCSECHGHSADFSRKFLKVVDGKLTGPMHKESFKPFLSNHYVRRNQEDAIYDMLLAENQTEPRFKEECSSCHKSAAEFVRESITLKDGELYDKKLDTLVSDYLESHRNLKDEDIEFFMNLLTRVANEVYRP